MAGVRLVWDGKSAEVPRLRLPLQVVETVNAPRGDRGTLFQGGPAEIGEDAADGWRNRLIWGDNLHVLASLADELAGQVDLVYIDPPFDSRQDYKVPRPVLPFRYVTPSRYETVQGRRRGHHARTWRR